MALFFFVFSTGGCGGGGSDGDGGAPIATEHTLSVLGRIPEELVGPMRETGIEMAEFDTENPAVHKSVLITKEALSEIVSGTGIAQDIYNIYNSGTEKTGHIVLYRPDNADIAKLGEILGESFGGGVDAGGSLLFYAIDMDTNGVRTFSHMDSNGLTERITSGVDPEGLGDDETEFLERVITSEISSADQKAMKDWLLDDGSGKESGNAKVSHPDDNLLGLAKSYQSTQSWQPWGKRLTTNVFITGLHVFDDETNPDGGSDWFFIREDNQFNGAPGYFRHWISPKDSPYTSRVNGERTHCNGGEVADNFIENVKVVHSLHGNLDDVMLTDIQPTTINGSTTYSATAGFNLGGSVTGGYQGSGPVATASFSWGISASETRSFSTPDVSVTMTTEANKIPSWEYSYAIPYKTGANLKGGAALAWTVYTPQQVWIWRIPTNSRSEREYFYLRYEITRGAVISWLSGTRDPKHRTGSMNTDWMWINFPYPPLLAFEGGKTDFVFDRTGGSRNEESQSVTIKGQGGWDYEVTSGGGDWLNLYRGKDDVLQIGVSENTTGAVRSAEITVTRNVKPADAKAGDVAVLTVTQLTTL
jgi:hypothetical protein